MPLNTNKNNQWALKNYTDWSTLRSQRAPNDPVPEDVLSSMDPGVICKWLCRYVLETRQENGKQYPPKTIYSLLCGLLRVSQDRGGSLNFLNKLDARFTDLHRTMDSVCSQLHSEGFGAFKKSAPVISFEDQQLLWDAGLLGLDSPPTVFNTVFFYVGLHFCLRGGQEHRNLSLEQLKRYPPEYDIYTEDTYYDIQNSFPRIIFTGLKIFMPRIKLLKHSLRWTRVDA